MDFDLSLLHSQTKEEIDISGTYTIPEEYFSDDSVIKAENISVEGKVYMVESIDEIEDEADYIKAKINGTLIIEDAISLEPLEYPISIEYDDILEENCKKMKIHLIYFGFYGKILYWRSP